MPEGSAEVALGPRLLDDIDKAVGDTVGVTVAFVPFRKPCRVDALAQVRLRIP